MVHECVNPPRHPTDASSTRPAHARRASGYPLVTRTGGSGAFAYPRLLVRFAIQDMGAYLPKREGWV